LQISQIACCQERQCSTIRTLTWMATLNSCGNMPLRAIARRKRPGLDMGGRSLFALVLPGVSSHPSIDPTCGSRGNVRGGSDLLDDSREAVTRITLGILGDDEVNPQVYCRLIGAMAPGLLVWWRQ